MNSIVAHNYCNISATSRELRVGKKNSGRKPLRIRYKCTSLKREKQNENDKILYLPPDYSHHVHRIRARPASPKNAGAGRRQMDGPFGYRCSPGIEIGRYGAQSDVGRASGANEGPVQSRWTAYLAKAAFVDRFWE